MMRLYNLCLSVLGLILTLPAFLMIALVIPRDSVGPVFFRQIRVGQFRRLFRIYKFRTMVVYTQKLGVQEIRGSDARIREKESLLESIK